MNILYKINENKEQAVMRIKKWMLRIAGGVFLVSLALAIGTANGSKINNIFIGIMGSSLVSFLIEFPEYFIEYKRVKNSFFNISFNIWFYLNQYLFFINKELEEGEKRISENTFSLNINEINRLFMEFNYIDEYLYSKNPKYKKFIEGVREVQNALNHNKIAFAIYVNIKQRDQLKLVGNEAVTTSDMKKEISILEEKTRSKLELYENEFKKIMNDKELKDFENNKLSVDNTNKNYKDGGVRFI